MLHCPDVLRLICCSQNSLSCRTKNFIMSGCLIQPLFFCFTAIWLRAGRTVNYWKSCCWFVSGYVWRCKFYSKLRRWKLASFNKYKTGNRCLPHVVWIMFYELCFYLDISGSEVDRVENFQVQIFFKILSIFTEVVLKHDLIHFPLVILSLFSCSLPFGRFHLSKTHATQLAFQAKAFT